MLNRREFLRNTSLAACAGALSGAHLGTAAAQTGGPLKKAVCIGVLPRDLPLPQRFELAQKAGFEGIEPNTLRTPEEVQQYKEAAKSTGIKLHSIMNSDHWKFPLSDPNPEVVKQCVDGIKTSMQNAHEVGADAVLLVPGVVTADVRYVDVYKRSQEQIHKLLPMAKDLGVIIAIENVGNRFLLSPIEFTRYVEEFSSPYVKAYFDIGNIVSNGWPQDWIRTIGKQLVKVHIKRMEPGSDQPKFDPADRRGQGINWPDVRRALTEVAYTGWVTAEVKPGDETYLRDLSSRMDKFIAGESPI